MDKIKIRYENSQCDKGEKIIFEEEVDGSMTRNEVEDIRWSRSQELFLKFPDVKEIRSSTSDTEYKQGMHVTQMFQHSPVLYLDKNKKPIYSQSKIKNLNGQVETVILYPSMKRLEMGVNINGVNTSLSELELSEWEIFNEET